MFADFKRLKHGVHHLNKLMKYKIGILNEEEKIFSMKDLAEHNTPKDCWVTVNGNVYDVTEFIPNHPNEYIKNKCGTDVFAVFKRMNHGVHHLNKIMKYKIGLLQEDEIVHTEDIKKKEKAEKEKKKEKAEKEKK